MQRVCFRLRWYQIVEGLDARSLFLIEKRERMVFPGSILFLIGLLMPIAIHETDQFYGRFNTFDGGAFNLAFSAIMFLGLIMAALGIIFREKGEIHKPIAASLILILAADVFMWLYLPTIGLSAPTGLISILPFLSPAQIPMGLTLIFILLVLGARRFYRKDPRKTGKPKYQN
jgi:hypothetical protein